MASGCALPVLALPVFLPSQGACTWGSALHLVHKTDARQNTWLSWSVTHSYKSALLPLLTPPRSCCHCPFGIEKPNMTFPRCRCVCLPSLPDFLSFSLFFEEKEIDQALFLDGNAEATAGLGPRDCLDTQGRWLALAFQPPHQPPRLEEHG